MIPKALPALLIATILLFFATQPSFADNTLTLTVTTNKRVYGQSPNSVYVGGILAYQPNTNYVSQAVVGIEVKDPSGRSFILRALPTNATTTRNWVVNFTEFYPCDALGVPKYSFQTGESVFLHAEWENFDPVNSYTGQYDLTLYDANSVSLGIIIPTPYFLLAPNSTYGITYLLAMISTSTIGNVTIFGSLFSDFPRNSGYPYCPERNATIAIGSASGNTPFELSYIGTYNFSFTLPGSKHYENYTVYASSLWLNTLVTSNATFSLKIVGDINGDGVVNILDGILLSNAFGSAPGNSKWNPEADLNGDGIVNILDAIILANNFGLSG
jgi:hypothetical protein